MLHIRQWPRGREGERKYKNYNDRPVVVQWRWLGRRNKTKQNESKPKSVNYFRCERNANRKTMPTTSNECDQNGWTIFPPEWSNVLHMCYDYYEKMFWCVQKLAWNDYRLFFVFARRHMVGRVDLLTLLEVGRASVKWRGKFHCLIPRQDCRCLQTTRKTKSRLPVKSHLFPFNWGTENTFCPTTARCVHKINRKKSQKPKRRRKLKTKEKADAQNPDINLDITSAANTDRTVPYFRRMLSVNNWICCPNTECKWRK